MTEDAAPPRDLGPTGDVVFLALTRPTVSHRVPLAGFMASFGAACFFTLLEKALLPQVNVFVRLGVAGVFFLAVMAVMVRLTSWEPHWFRILGGWAEVRARQLLKPWTRLFGGTTASPLPVGLRRDRARLRAYAG